MLADTDSKVEFNDFTHPYLFQSGSESIIMESITYCLPGRIFCKAKNILLAVDGSEGSATAATVAFEIAEMTKSKLFVVHVVPTPSVNQLSLMTDMKSDEVLARYLDHGRSLLAGYDNASKEFNIETELILEQGLPAERVIRAGDENGVDLIVIGSRGISGGRRAGMGSTTERIVLMAECPVMVVK
jgi:nucleotide-binding universal stress UspA family protein